MEDKIRKIMDESTDYQTGEVDAEIAISKLLDLFSVSKRFEIDFDVRISFLIGKWSARQDYFTEVAEKAEKIEHAIRFNAKAQATRDCWKELSQLKNES